MLTRAALVLSFMRALYHNESLCEFAHFLLTEWSLYPQSDVSDRLGHRQ